MMYCSAPGMDELAEKCNEGQLPPDERFEYETSIRFRNFIAILQAKARASVAKQSVHFPLGGGKRPNCSSARRIN